MLASHSEVLQQKLYQNPTLTLRGDTEIWTVLLKFCYNIRDPLPDISISWFISLYKEAERYKMSEMQDWLLQQETFSRCPGRKDVLYLEAVELALENSKQFPRLSEALYRRARAPLP